MRRRNNKKTKKRPILLFLKAIFLLLLTFTIAFGGYVAYLFITGQESDLSTDGEKSILSDFLAPKVPERTNVLLIGVDNEKELTDTIILASFNSITKNLHFISIPRDTRVIIPQDRWDVMVKNYSALSKNTSRKIRINSVHKYGGKENGVSFLEKQLEEMFSIKIDYYAKVDTEGFRYLVDSIGGIEFNVPRNMKYSDPTQDLYINLKKGIQLLDGDKAEQLVRFRKGYASQDLQRNEVQRDFLKAFIAKALSTSTIFSNPMAYLNTLVNYVETDFKITNAVKYIKSLSGFSSENIIGTSLPGSPKSIKGVAYFIYDENALQDLIYDVFISEPISKDNVALEDSFDKEIVVLNGGYTSGMAGKVKKLLERKGYKIKYIGDSPDEKDENTKIYVKVPGQGEDLVKFFKNAKTYVNSDKIEYADILIVIGADEKLVENGE